MKRRRVEDECATDERHGGAVVATTTAAADTAAAAAATSIAEADEVVTLNVGGTLVTTLASTLRACRSRFCDWLRNDFRHVPRDDDGYPFLDRDVVTFRHVLNYLRGYDLPSKADELLLLAEDAVYYDMTQLKADLCIESPARWCFAAGPGVSPDGDTFSTADILGLCGVEALLPSQTHSIIFRVDKCELVEVGVVALAAARENCQVHHVCPSVSYCNTGELVKHWASEPVYVPGEVYKAQELVSVRVQFVEHGSPLLDGHVDDASANAVVTTTTATAQPPPLLSPTRREGASAAPALVRASELHRTSLARSEDDDDEEQQQQQESSRAVTTTTTTTTAAAATCSDDVEATAYAATPHPERPLAGALVTFCHENKVVFEALWPAPVPPLQFAVSMQGTSAVSIVDVVSIDRQQQQHHVDISNSSSNGLRAAARGYALAPLRGGGAYTQLVATAGRVRGGLATVTAANNNNNNSSGSSSGGGGRGVATSVPSLPLLSVDTLEANAMRDLTPLSLGFDHII